MTKTDAKLALLDRLVDSTATDAQTGREIKVLAREVARAAIQDLTAAAARVGVGRAEATKAVTEALTPSGVKIISHGDNR